MLLSSSQGKSQFKYKIIHYQKKEERMNTRLLDEIFIRIKHLKKNQYRNFALGVQRGIIINIKLFKLCKITLEYVGHSVVCIMDKQISVITLISSVKHFFFIYIWIFFRVAYFILVFSITKE